MKNCLFIILFLVQNASAQDSLLQQLSGDLDTKVHAVSAVFKATQIVNTPTVEAPATGNLQFMIMHRFGRINEGGYALFGLDNAEIRFALDYGITPWLAVGVGRSSFEKVYDASVKLKLLRQAPQGAPLAASLYLLAANPRLRYSDKPYLNFRNRFQYTSALLLARKFSSALSLQLTPYWIHYNLVSARSDANDVFAAGFGGRYKLTRRTSINAEYSYVPEGQVKSTRTHNSLSAGIDLETGGHVFQLIFSNSVGMIAPYYLTKTTESWGDGGIYFGFNITRNFLLRKNKKWDAEASHQ